MGKLIFDDRNGYSFISDNGVEYDLLEGRLQMKDHWSSEDFDQDREWARQIRELEKQLKEVE